MKKNIIQIPIKGLSRDEWLDKRRDYIGASDVGTVLGLNRDYKSRLELYLEKIGEKELNKAEREDAYWGRKHEPTIAKSWQHYDPANPYNYMKNDEYGIIIRKCHKVNSILVNRKFAWLCGDLDRIINKTDERGEGVLECKTMIGFVAAKYIGELPTSYYTQLQTYLAITELGFGEIASLKDGNKFTVLPFNRNEIMIEKIISATKEFYDRVQLGIGLKMDLKLAQEAEDIDAIQKIRGDLQHNEPDPEDSTAYNQFLNERYRSNGQMIFARKEHDQIYQLGLEYMELNRREKNIVEQKVLPQVLIKDFLKEFTGIDFGEKGKITWIENSKGTRVLYVKLKEASIF